MIEPPLNQVAWARFLAVGVAVLLGGFLLLTSTITLVEGLWQYDVKRILELCMLPLIIGIVLLNRTIRGEFQIQTRRLPAWLGASLGLLVCLGILSAVLSSNSAMSLAYSLAEVFLLSLLVLAVLCVAACRRIAGETFDQAAILLIAIVSVAVGIQELLGVIAAWNAGLEFHPRIALLHFSWPRFYNQVQSWSLPVIAALPLVFPGKPLAKLLCVIALALGWYVALATGGRGTMVAVAVALVASSILFRAERKTLLQYHLVGLFAGLLIYALVVLGHQNVLRPDPASFAHSKQAGSSQPASRKAADTDAILPANGDSSGQFLEPLTGKRMWTSSGRLPMWRGALRETLAHPWLGIGPMNYACTGPIYRAAHPHNFPLQLMVEWGVPAALLLLGVVLFLLVRILSAALKAHLQPDSRTALAGCLATGMFAAAIHACLSGVMVMPASQVTGVLIGGWLLGWLPSQPATRRAGVAPIGVLLAGLVVSLSVLVFARQEIRVAEVRLEQTEIMDRGIPRFWQNGKVCRLYRDAVRRTNLAR